MEYARAKMRRPGERLRVPGHGMITGEAPAIIVVSNENRRLLRQCRRWGDIELEPMTEEAARAALEDQRQLAKRSLQSANNSGRQSGKPEKSGGSK